MEHLADGYIYGHNKRSVTTALLGITITVLVVWVVVQVIYLKRHQQVVNFLTTDCSQTGCQKQLVPFDEGVDIDFEFRSLSEPDYNEYVYVLSYHYNNLKDWNMGPVVLKLADMNLTSNLRQFFFMHFDSSNLTTIDLLFKKNYLNQFLFFSWNGNTFNTSTYFLTRIFTDYTVDSYATFYAPNDVHLQYFQFQTQQNVANLTLLTPDNLNYFCVWDDGIDLNELFLSPRYLSTFVTPDVCNVTRTLSFALTPFGDWYLKSRYDVFVNVTRYGMKYTYEFKSSENVYHSPIIWLWRQLKENLANHSQTAPEPADLDTLNVKFTVKPSWPKFGSVCNCTAHIDYTDSEIVGQIGGYFSYFNIFLVFLIIWFRSKYGLQFKEDEIEEKLELGQVQEGTWAHSISEWKKRVFGAPAEEKEK